MDSTGRQTNYPCHLGVMVGYAYATDIEYRFNGLNSVPAVSMITSPVRMVLGLAQLISGVALTIVARLAISLCSSEKKRYWESMYLAGATHAFHGAANILRGGIELVAAVTTFGIATLIYNMRVGKYNPWIHYGEYSEDMQSLNQLYRVRYAYAFKTGSSAELNKALLDVNLRLRFPQMTAVAAGLCQDQHGHVGSDFAVFPSEIRGAIFDQYMQVVKGDLHGELIDVADEDSAADVLDEI